MSKMHERRARKDHCDGSEAMGRIKKQNIKLASSKHRATAISHQGGAPHGPVGTEIQGVSHRHIACIEIFHLRKLFPREEVYSLTDQILVPRELMAAKSCEGLPQDFTS